MSLNRSYPGKPWVKRDQ